MLQTGSFLLGISTVEVLDSDMHSVYPVETAMVGLPGRVPVRGIPAPGPPRPGRRHVSEPHPQRGNVNSPHRQACKSLFSCGRLLSILLVTASSFDSMRVAERLLATGKPHRELSLDTPRPWWCITRNHSPTQSSRGSTAREKSASPRCSGMRLHADHIPPMQMVPSRSSLSLRWPGLMDEY